MNSKSKKESKISYIPNTALNQIIDKEEEKVIINFIQKSYRLEIGKISDLDIIQLDTPQESISLLPSAEEIDAPENIRAFYVRAEISKKLHILLFCQVHFSHAQQKYIFKGKVQPLIDFVDIEIIPNHLRSLL